MAKSSIGDKLRKVVPKKTVLDSPLQKRLYGYDGTIYEGTPDAAVLPENAEQIVAIVLTCHNAGVPVVPRGAATSLSGGPVPVLGGVVVSMTGMNRILEQDYANMCAVVQPGVVNQQLQAALGKDGFYYAPDPSSQSVCTIGGNVGENSGGPHCLKYGVTANHVLGLEVVLSDGQALRIGGKTNDSLGYDILGVLVGNEGTLALATEITCRVVAKPENVITMLVIFNRLDEASQAVSDIIAAGVIPATLEMMDNAMIRAVEMALKAGYPEDAEAVLIVEVDGLPARTRAEAARVKDACRKNNAVELRIAKDETERTLLWKGRKGAFGAVVNIAPSKICTDIAVPRSMLPSVLAEVMTIGRRHNVPIANVFHAGDGNLHPLVLYDPRDKDLTARVKLVDQEISQLALASGGVLTGEHGIGCCKRRYMVDMFGPAELRLMWRIKKAFDPSCILNPGKVLPDEDEIERAAIAQANAPDPDANCIPVFENSQPQNINGYRPETPDGLFELLRQSDIEHRPITIRGAGTKIGFLGRGRIEIDTRSLTRVIKYDYENLTLTAECGVTLAKLDDVTAKYGQMVALRPRNRLYATLGGVTSTNDAGPSRLLYGAPRDLVTGLTAMLSSGERVHFGSACVKNVSGYAVEKLIIGSWGSLAAIYDVTLRLIPKPERRLTLAVSLEMPERAIGFAEVLRQSPLSPASVELLNPSASEKCASVSGWLLLLGLEGFSEEVDELASRIGTLAKRHGLSAPLEIEADYLSLWDAVADLAPGPVAKIAVEPVRTIAVVSELNSVMVGSAAAASICLGQVVCSLGTGLDLGSSLDRIRMVAETHNGVMFWPQWEGLPHSSRPDRPVEDLCQRIKQAFDPNGILPRVY